MKDFIFFTHLMENNYLSDSYQPGKGTKCLKILLFEKVYNCTDILFIKISSCFDKADTKSTNINLYSSRLQLSK